MIFVKVDQDKKQAVVDALKAQQVIFEDHPEGVELVGVVTVARLESVLKPLNMCIKVSKNA